MKEVWLIVRDTGVIQEQGVSIDEIVLSYKGHDPKAVYPAFPSKEKAQAYIDKHGIYARPQKVEVVRKGGIQ